MTTALVFTGGGSLGAVQVGMMLGLSDRHSRADLFVGSSVGAINAAYLAASPSHDRVEALAAVWARLRRTDVFPTSPTRVALALAGKVSGFADPAPLRALVTAHLPYARIEDSPWPLAVVATEVTTGREVVLTAGSAVDVVMASAALPGVFPAVDVDGHVLMDGGVVNNAPVSVAAALGADEVIVLPTGYACALAQPPRSPVGMAMHAVTVAIQRRLTEDIRALDGSVRVRVVPPLCPLTVSPIDFRHTTQLIERARAATRRWYDAAPPADPAAHLSLHRHEPTTSAPRVMDDACATMT